MKPEITLIKKRGPNAVMSKPSSSTRRCAVSAARNGCGARLIHIKDMKGTVAQWLR
jgi:hypothetical protein